MCLVSNVVVARYSASFQLLTASSFNVGLMVEFRGVIATYYISDTARQVSLPSLCSMAKHAIDVANSDGQFNLVTASNPARPTIDVHFTAFESTNQAT